MFPPLSVSSRILYNEKRQRRRKDENKCHRIRKQYGRFAQAVRKLSEIILDYTCISPVCMHAHSVLPDETSRYFFIGTRKTNPFLDFGEKPISPESYRLEIKDGNVYIEGADAAGALYGAVDFYAKYLVYAESTHASAPYLKNPFEEEFAPFSLTGAPALSNRGLWTWGHVIYDFRGYIDNMVRLKMNTVIIWNDFAPVNAREMVAYAHENNIRLFWGFPWGWDTDCREIDIGNLEKYTRGIFEHYEKNYAATGADGIYFQTCTELNTESLNGVVIAEKVTEFVNHTAGVFYEKYPTLEIQFGLHATSVREKLEYLKNTDPRIRIVWENCGAFPFDYLPENIASFDETAGFVEKIMRLRGENEKFGAVLKGLTKLDWNAFEHQKGPYILGNGSGRLMENRVLRKQPIWRLLQAQWLKNGPKALEMLRTIQKNAKDDIVVTALVEDGMFEKNIYLPAALMGMMMWEREMEFSDILCEAALSRHVVFA